MNRREFLTTTGLAAGAAFAAATNSPAAITHAEKSRDRCFALNFAPHFGMFQHSAGDDLVDQIKFMADQGFRAVEDVGLKQRSRSLQKRLRRELDRQNMQMGVFTATADFGTPTFASGRIGFREKVLAEMRESVEVAKRVGAQWCTVVPGKLDHRLSTERQTAYVVETLKRCAEICELSELVMVLEPIDHGAGHVELFLRRISQAFAICQAVDSPSCKILFDVYHQQNSADELIRSIDASSGEIAYFQIGDNPGRKEPGTGEIDYGSLFQSLARRGYQGIVGMEHGNSKPGREGEQAVIQSYVTHNNFAT